MSNADQSQPGWYSDPYVSGQLRWFDGGSWTFHVAEVPAANAGKHEATASSTAPGGKPSSATDYVARGRRWYHTLSSTQRAGVAAGVAALGVLLLLMLIGLAHTLGKTPCEREAEAYVQETGGSASDYQGYVEGCREAMGPNG